MGVRAYGPRKKEVKNTVREGLRYCLQRLAAFSARGIVKIFILTSNFKFKFVFYFKASLLLMF